MTRKWLQKKKRERNVERLKNNTKRSKKKNENTKQNNICAAQAAAQNENKNGYTQRMQSLLKQSKGEVGRGCSRRGEEGRGGEGTAAAPQSKETKSLLNAKSGKN